MQFRNRLGLPTTFKYWMYEWLEVIGFVGANVCPRFTRVVLNVLTWFQSKWTKK